MVAGPSQTSLTLIGEAATRRLAEHVAPHLHPGDTLLLDGPVGAGKTAFARAVIQHRQLASGGPVEDVPSPTFTLVQTYAAGPDEIWHADLYRLTDPGEIAELGLEEAFETAICLVEWPDRLGGATPGDAATLRLEAEAPDRRRASLAGRGSLATRLAPLLAAEART